MRASRDGWWLLITILLAVALFGVVTALLLSLDSRTSGSEAVRTGGLVSAAVVALYALWLNDRRRRVEESRHELERRSNEQDRERVADERFARAVELLGHDADQVRVGALARRWSWRRDIPGRRILPACPEGQVAYYAFPPGTGSDICRDLVATPRAPTESSSTRPRSRVPW
jgi:type VI protein secretion system component VasK